MTGNGIDVVGMVVFLLALSAGTFVKELAMDGTMDGRTEEGLDSRQASWSWSMSWEAVGKIGRMQLEKGKGWIGGERDGG